MCFPKWLLVLLMQLVNFKLMLAFAAKLIWKALSFNSSYVLLSPGDDSDYFHCSFRFDNVT